MEKRVKNPWKFVEFKIYYYHQEPPELLIRLKKRDIRGGYDLGKHKVKDFLIEKIDYKNRDKQYWKTLFCKILELNKTFKCDIPYKERTKIIQNIRQVRFIEYRRPRFTEWYDRYNVLAVGYFYYFFDNKKEQYSCMDNFRVARLKDKKALGRYERQREKGCCGYYDEVIWAPDLRRYKIGFNYGH